MYKYYNAHPQGKFVGDCAKRAISLASGISYHDTSLALNRYKKKTGAKVYNDFKRNLVPYILDELHGEKMSFPAVCGLSRMNGERFCKKYPNGNYILQMAGHLTACVDGVIYDTWNCSEKCVYTAYRIPKKSETESTIIKNADEILATIQEGSERAQVDKKLFELEMLFAVIAKKVDYAERHKNFAYVKYFTPYLNGIVDCIAVLYGWFDRESNQQTMSYLCHKWFTASQPEKPECQNIGGEE